MSGACTSSAVCPAGFWCDWLGDLTRIAVYSLHALPVAPVTISGGSGLTVKRLYAAVATACSSVGRHSVSLLAPMIVARASRAHPRVTGTAHVSPAVTMSAPAECAPPVPRVPHTEFGSRVARVEGIWPGILRRWCGVAARLASSVRVARRVAVCSERQYGGPRCWAVRGLFWCATPMHPRSDVSRRQLALRHGPRCLRHLSLASALRW